MEQGRLLIAIVLSVLVFTVWGFFFQDNTPPPQQSAQTQPESSLPADSPAAGPAVSIQEKPLPAFQKTRDLVVNTPLYAVTISDKGAFFKHFVLKHYRESVDSDSPSKELVSLSAAGTPSPFLYGKQYSGFNGCGVSVHRLSRQPGGSGRRPGSLLSVDIAFRHHHRKTLHVLSGFLPVWPKHRHKNNSGKLLQDHPALSLIGNIQRPKTATDLKPQRLITMRWNRLLSRTLPRKTCMPVGSSGPLEERYFLSGIVPAVPVESSVRLSLANGRLDNSLVEPEFRIDSGAQKKFEYKLYMGPKSYSILKTLGIGLDRAIHFGFCACCGGSRLAKIGEDVTKTLEEIPRRFKLIETVREKFTCRGREKISQRPAPFHATPRGSWPAIAGGNDPVRQVRYRIPLNRQSARFKCEGIDLPLSTLADQVGHGTFAVMPLFHLIERHVLAAERLHGDDTTIRILAKGKCTTGRIWTYVRDDRPFAGPAPPAAVYYASSDRRGEHPQKHLAAFAGILQADCYNGFEPLFDPQKKVLPITPAFCFAHARRGFFELADMRKCSGRQEGQAGLADAALEAVRRLDALFEIERAINGRGADERRAVRQEKSKPLLEDMHAWLLREREPSRAPPRS